MFLPFVVLGLSGVLLYFGFAPQAPRWHLGLGILGAAIAIAVWWWVSSIFAQLRSEEFLHFGFAETMYVVNALLCLATACSGAALAVALRGRRRLAALGLGVVLPLMIGQIFFAAMDARQQANEQHRLDSIQADLDQHRALWQANHPARYRFTLHTSMFCAPGHCPPSETVTVTYGYVSGWTVEKLFGRIQDAIDQNYYTVDATYHPQLGYPMMVRTDPNPLISDQSIQLTVADFQILQ